MKKLYLLILTTIFSLSLVACQSDEMKQAIADFDAAVASVTAMNTEVDEAVAVAEETVLAKEPVLDVELIPQLETAISSAKAAKQEIPERPKELEEIVEMTKKLSEISYDEVLKTLTDTHTELKKSAERYKLVFAPEEAYVIQALEKVPNIVNIAAATEENDPNGNLNKAGGYTAQVYFSSDLINQSEIYGDSLIEKGTDAGGSIEVYATVEDATDRNDYLAIYDGSIFASGSHKVIGTVLVRTSDELTATQQKTLESNIVAALTFLEGDPEIQ
ncbi:MAG: hypothetical protein Q4A54_09115 [Parabacteroides sp.]|nr:hypothetical protein [Parabacteroides sp.]